MENQNTSFVNPEAIVKQAGLTPGAKVASLGCGTGYVSFAAAKEVGPKGIVYAVDVQKTVLEQVKKEAQVENIANIAPVWADIEVPGATKIPYGTIDTAFLVNVLFQIQDKKSVFEEAAHLLKQGGSLVVIDWKPGTTGFGPAPEQRLSVENIQTLAAGAGFVTAGAIDAGQYHQGIKFIKS